MRTFKRSKGKYPPKVYLFERASALLFVVLYTSRNTIKQYETIPCDNSEYRIKTFFKWYFLVRFER